MRRHRSSVAIVSALLALGVLAGCVESDPDAAETPPSANTVANSALQTDSEGNTITAPEAPAPEAPAGETGGETPDAGGGGGDVDVAAAVSVFTSASPPCSSCHTLEAAGSTAMIGPNLDESLEGQSAEFVRESILDPGAETAEGFPAGIMPAYDSLSAEQVDLLVGLLTQ